MTKEVLQKTINAPIEDPSTGQHKGRATRQRLLENAFKVFAHKGYDGASLREIANLTHENVGLIVYYFGNKDQLWQACVDYHFKMVREVFIQEMLKQTTNVPHEQLRHLLRTVVQIAAHYPEQMMLMVRQGQDSSPRMQWLFETHLKPIFDLFCQIAEAGVKAGIVPDIARVHLYYMVMGAASTLFTAKVEAELLLGKTFDQETIEHHTEAMVKVFLIESTQSPK